MSREGEINLTEAREQTIILAVKAGDKLRNFFYGEFTQTQKSGVDFTTQADKEADRFISEELLRLFPQSKVLSEEAVEGDYSSLKYEENLWVVDPQDGTINFSRGHENFAVSIALGRLGVSRLGIIHMPLRRETYWAQEDLPGAFRVLTNEPIRVSNTKSLREVLVAIDWPYDLEQRQEVLRWAACFAPYVRQIKSTGSAVCDLAMVAAGKIDIYVQLGTKPWDTAAGRLLVKKAGGEVTTPEGEECDMFNNRILATNGVLHKTALELINN